MKYPKKVLEEKCSFKNTIIIVGRGMKHPYFCGILRDKVQCLFYTNDPEFTQFIKVGDSKYPIIKEDAGECSYYLYGDDILTLNIFLEKFIRLMNLINQY